MNIFEELRLELTPFLDKVFALVKELNINVSDLDIDHIALRYKNSKDVDKLAAELQSQAKILSQAIVNGRKIYIFKLNTPLLYKKYKIPCVELPYPAINHDYPRDGWEHVEFFLPSKNINEFEQTFKKRFPNLTEEILKKYNYTLSIPQVQGEQLLNPSAILSKEKGLAIKFHPNSIEKVVAS